MEHNFQDILSSLDKKRDVFVNPNTNSVHINRGACRKNDLGNGSLGKIDYLRNTLHFVEHLHFPKKEEEWKKIVKENS